MTLYHRMINVSVAGLSISEPRIAFSIDKTADRTQDTGYVHMYNLSPAHEAQIYERSTAIVVEAGYPSTIGVVFEGQVQRVFRPRASLAHIVEIELGDTAHSVETPDVTARVYEGPIPIRTIFTDLAGDLGMSTGPLDAIPAGATIKDFTWSGPTHDALTAITQRVDCDWYDDDGVLRVRFVGKQVQPDAPGITVSPANGLIGVPAETDDGAEARMFLNPLAKRGGLLTLQSEALSGSWRIVALRHDGDNWQAGPFATWVDLRAA